MIRTMVEKIALVIESDRLLQRQNAEMRATGDDPREIAITILHEMREPTEKMLDQAMWASSRTRAKMAWEDMIDAALREGE